MSVPFILVIEDNVADLVLIRYALDELGEPYRIEVLEDGEAALDFVSQCRLRDRRNEPCVILLDLHLPRYNGIEVLTAIREEPVLTDLHVLVLTSDASPEELKQITDLGGICCFKPSGLDQIKSLAKDIMALCKGAPLDLATPAAS